MAFQKIIDPNKLMLSGGISIKWQLCCMCNNYFGPNQNVI
jgi:hypothetical protein